MALPDKDDAATALAILPEPVLLYIPWYGYIERPRYFWQVVSLIAAIVLLPPLGLETYLRTLDANAFRPRIIAALQAATGRNVDIQGKIQLSGGLTPRFGFGPLIFLGRPTASRADVGRIERVEAQLALWPLLRGAVAIERLDLQAPDVLLERGADGQDNWTTAASAPVPPSNFIPNLAGLRELVIREGRVSWRDRATGGAANINIKRVAITFNGDDNLTLNTDATLGRDRILISGETGSLPRLLDRAGTTPWPVNLKLQMRGANFSLDGSFTRPQEAKGYKLQVNADIRESQNFRAYLPADMPPLRNIVLSAQLADGGKALPEMSLLSLVVGASDLTGLFPGGRLERLELRAADMNAALHGEVKGVIGGAAMQGAAVFGTPRGVLLGAMRLGWLPAWVVDASDGPATAFPIDIAAALGDSEVSASGAIADPARMAGLALALNASISNMQKLEPVFKRRLPVWDFARLQAQISDFGGSLLDGLALRDLTLATGDGDIAGTASIRFGARPDVVAQLHGGQLDFDRLNTSFAALHFGAPPPLPIAAPPGMRKQSPYLGDRPLALGGFDLGDLDLRLSLDQARLWGLAYQALDSHVVLRSGRMAIEHATAMSPGGLVAVDFSYDTKAATAPMALHVRAPSLAVKPVLIALQRGEDMTGNLELDVNLAAAGRDLHALAGSVQGRAGLALVNGDLNTIMFSQMLYNILRAARLPMHLMSAGPSNLRCFAVALVANHGEGVVESFVLDTERLLIQASGGFQAGDELIDLRIRPQLRFGGPALSMPLRLAGSFVDARLQLDPDGDRPAAGKAFVARAQAAEAGADACTAALKAARNGADGPLPKDKPTAVTQVQAPEHEDN